MTRGAVMAGGAAAVVHVVAAVVARPAVDAHALVAAVGVVAGAAILAGVGHELALVDVVPAKLTWGREGGRRGEGWGGGGRQTPALVLKLKKLNKTKLNH